MHTIHSEALSAIALHGSPLRATPLQYLIQTEVVANHNGKK
jgi:hypothetical protein